jgi:GNAT superfamily N-acetyltransferase
LATNDSQLPAGIRLRDYRPEEDIAAYVEIHNLLYAPERTTVEQELHWDRIYPPEYARLRRLAVSGDGRAVGVGACLLPYWMIAPGVLWIEIVVHPEWQRRGIGRAILAELEPFAREKGGTRLRTNCSWSGPDSPTSASDTSR